MIQLRHYNPLVRPSWIKDTCVVPVRLVCKLPNLQDIDVNCFNELLRRYPLGANLDEQKVVHHQPATEPELLTEDLGNGHFAFNAFEYWSPYCLMGLEAHRAKLTQLSTNRTLDNVSAINYPKGWEPMLVDDGQYLLPNAASTPLRNPGIMANPISSTQIPSSNPSLSVRKTFTPEPTTAPINSLQKYFSTFQGFHREMTEVQPQQNEPHYETVPDNSIMSCQRTFPYPPKKPSLPKRNPLTKLAKTPHPTPLRYERIVVRPRVITYEATTPSPRKTLKKRMPTPTKHRPTAARRLINIFKPKFSPAPKPADRSIESIECFLRKKGDQLFNNTFASLKSSPAGRKRCDTPPPLLKHWKVKAMLA